MTAIKEETGEKRQFSTGAKRQASEGKGLPSLFPPDGYMELCKHFEDGAKLHGGRNWEKGLPLASIIDSLERHIAAVKMGLTGERHDRALAWNALVFLTTNIRIAAGILPKELDDLEGAYREQEQEQETERGEGNFNIHKMYVNGIHCFYVYEIISMTYLQSDLKLYKECMTDREGGLTGYFETRGDADACIQEYLRKQECGKCKERIRNAKDGEAIPVPSKIMSSCQYCPDYGYIQEGNQS